MRRHPRCLRYLHRSAVKSLGEVDRDPVTFALPDHFPKFSFDRQFVGAVSEGHERASKWLAIDGPCDLDQASGTEELGGSGHDDVGPASLVWALPKLCRESLIKHAHRIAPSRTV